MNFCKTSPRFSLPLSKLTGRHTLHATHVRERGGTKSRGIGEGGGGKVENFFSFSLSGLSLASFFSTLSGALCPPPSPPKSYFFPLFFFPGNAFFLPRALQAFFKSSSQHVVANSPKREEREGGERVAANLTSKNSIAPRSSTGHIGNWWPSEEGKKFLFFPLPCSKLSPTLEIRMSSSLPSPGKVQGGWS